jgi:hypothetical protein
MRLALPAGALLFALVLPGQLRAQDAAPADVETVDGIIAALYDVISGPMGEERDFDRFKSLFAPDGRLIPTAPNVQNGYLYWTPDEYWSRNAQALSDIGFTEAEIGRVTESFGNVTHVFSTYESYRLDQGEPDGPFARGINSIQLVRANGRYWILTVTWDSEREGNPIPERYIGR